MRERRTTVRVGCFVPAAYRPADGSLDATGRITNLSIGGLRLLTHQPLSDGAHLALNFTLPNEEEPVSVAGLIRWNGPVVSGEIGRQVGVEFAKLDETTHFCLQAFVTDQTKPAVGIGRLGRGIEWRQDGLATRLLKVGWPLLIAILSAGLCLGILQLQQQKEQLRQTLAERTGVINQLEVARQQLAQELDHTRAAAALTATELGRLQQERAQLETDMGGLIRNLGEMRQAYLRLREERDALKDRMLVLEQQQAVLATRLTSIPELHKAIREAYQVAATQRRAQRSQWVTRMREADQQALQHGNRGYVIHDGQPMLTSGSGRLSIRVLSPEPTAQPSP